MSNGKTILLVEDEAIIAVIHQKILTKYGFNVITAGTGEKAVEVAVSTPGIDLILMDINLGEGIDGTEAAERILADKEIPLVFLSSHTEPEVVDKTEGITSYGYIVKNSGETVLTASIRMAFKLFEAKQKEREKEEKYRLISENTSDGIFVYENGEIVYASPAYAGLTGYSVNEILGRKESDFIDFIHSEDRESLVELVAEVKNERKASLNYQFRYKHKNGLYFWREDHTSFSYDEEGNFLRVYVVARDISERKTHEERIKLMSEMLDEAPGAITVHDYEGNFLYANKNTYRLHGYDEDFLFKKLEDIDVPESAELIEERMKSIDEEGEAVFKADHYRKDGSVVPLEVAAKKVTWGDTPAVLSVAVDITERLKAKEALQESEEKYRVLFEDSPEAYLLIDSAVIIDCNRASLSLMRCDKNYIVGKSPCEFAPETQPGGTSSRDLMNIKIAEAYRKGTITFEFIHLRPDGTEFQAEVSLSLVTLFSKSVIFASWRDISDKVFAFNLMQKTLNRFKALLENSPSLIAIFDSTGRNIEVSKAMANVYGLSPDELRGKTFYDLLPAEAADDFMDTLNLLRERRELIIKTDTIVLNGEERIYESRLFPIDVEDEAKKLFCSIAVDITARINAENKLRESESLLKNAQSMAGLGNWALNIATGELIWSDEIYRIFGLDSEKFKADYQNFLKIIHPEDVDAVNAAYTSSIAEGRDFYEIDHRIIRADNCQIVYVHEKCEHIRDDSGTIIRSLGMVQDITERKNAEETYRNLFLNSQIGIFRSEVETGNVIDANDTFARIAGYKDRDSLLADSFNVAECYIDPQQRNLMISTLKETGEVNNFETLFKRIDGNLVWMRFSARHNSEKAWLEGVTEDVTVSKNSADQLRESEEKYRMLFHHSPLGIYVADKDGNIVDANDRMLNILGSPSLEATKTVNIFNLPLLTESGYAEKFRESIELNTVSTIEFNYTSKWGKTIFSSNYIVPVADSAGRVGKVFTLVEDITLRKQIEKYRELSGEILSVLNSADDLKDSVSRILLLLKEKTGSDAVGIRLSEGDDYPYFIQNGFSNDFILQENSLISRNTCGDICVNNDGDVSLECTCGLVISGKTDPDNPLFTPGGSCWTNDSFPLLEMPESEDPRYKARNNCIHHGYASVALVPVKSRKEIVGLLQLNGYARNLFTIELVQELEIIAGRIGETLLRKQNEDKIRALLQEKELLLKETHHRVKNNMNTVYGLLYMQSEELSDPVSKSIIMEAASRVQSMMVMYDKLYRSENHHEMNVNDYLPSLIAEIISIFDSRIPVKTDIHVDDVVLSAKDLSAMGIIINELITNSMKYAFDNLDEGIISLSLTKEDNRVTVVYRDNGPGLPESVNFEDSTGFGMQLINMLVQQLGGTIEIMRDKGAEFVIRF